MSPTTQLDRRFIEELNGAAKAQPALVVDFTDAGDEASEGSLADSSGREGFESSGSTSPAGEPVHMC